MEIIIIIIIINRSLDVDVQSQQVTVCWGIWYGRESYLVERVAFAGRLLEDNIAAKNELS